MRTLVMGDIHGAYKALVQCLDHAGFDNTRDRLIQLGDVTDRNPDVYECVEALLKINNLVAIRGNHDAWLEEFITTGFHPNFWNHGGDDTARSYLKRAGKEKLIKRSGSGFKTGLDPQDIPLAHQAFFINQVDYFVDEMNNCYVHGGFNKDMQLSKQDPVQFYWNRVLWNQAMSYEQTAKGMPNVSFGMREPFRQVFLGHTPTLNFHTDQPMKGANVWNLDTGAGQGARLTIMDAATNEYWQSDPVKELYAD